MRTIDEEIKYSRNRAKANRNMAYNIASGDDCYDDETYEYICEQCANEFDQIADWLEELKVYRSKNDNIYQEGYELGYTKAIDDFATKMKELDLVFKTSVFVLHGVINDVSKRLKDKIKE